MIIRTEKPNIRGFSKDQLKAFFVEKGEKPFRADQVYQWVWQKSAASFQDMTNLPKDLRLFLENHFQIHQLKIASSQRSKDGTIKIAFELHDGKFVEGVLIPANDRMTACISSQVGCSLDCKFCATARLKMMRNLSPDEIYDQVVAINEVAKKTYGKHLTNIVYMGMGEPLLNYKNVMTSIQLITSPDGLGMSPQRITLSTSGIAKMIRKLGDDQVKFNLALSLHVANNEKRTRIMSINASNPLEELADALKYFYEKTKTRVTYEYIIFKDFNDDIQDARELAAFCKHIPCKVNIIEYNPIDDGFFQQASKSKTNAFIRYLESKGIIVNVRRSRGKDIDAACGQLANKVVQQA
jgi:23S rRNA (adenine2503-C2)-methyltransferase